MKDLKTIKFIANYRLQSLSTGKSIDKHEYW